MRIFSVAARRLDSPRLAALAVAAIYLIFLLARLSTLGFDPSRFVYAGDRFVDTGAAPSTLSVFRDSDGYDGQFFYRLALNPFTSQATESGIRLDVPPYRQQRIGYPLLAWGLALGRADLVPTTLIAVNYLAAGAMAFAGGCYAHTAGRHALWGAVLALYPGFVLSMALDLAEIVAACLVSTSLVLLRRGRHGFAALSLVLSVLTRETTTLVAVGAILARLLWRGDGPYKVPWSVALAPVAAYVLWQVFLGIRWGISPLEIGAPNLGPPLLGLLEVLPELHEGPSRVQLAWAIQFGFLGTFGAAVAVTLRSSKATAHEKLCWCLYAALVSSLSSFLWRQGHLAFFLRAFSEYFVLGNVVLIGSESRMRLPIVLGTVALWLVLARATLA